VSDEEVTYDDLARGVAGRVHEGDAANVLAELPANVVHTVVTSPPYFGLRNYGVEGQLGLEDSLDEYISELVAVFREVRRVLRPDGSLWLNLGDSYATRSGDRFDRKEKLLAPHRVAIALQEDGWIVRQDAVWQKSDPMPESVKDRLAETKEAFFHLVPSPDYYFDLDPIREEHAESSLERATNSREAARQYDHYPGREAESRAHNFDTLLHPGGKNLGDVIEVATESFRDGHFAVMPEALAETPILASAPSRVCPACGAAHERITEDVPLWEVENLSRPQLQQAQELAADAGLTEAHLEAVRAVGCSDPGTKTAERQAQSGGNTLDVDQLAAKAKDALGSYFREFVGSRSEHIGWSPTCDCGEDGSVPGLVLDPFAGAGTTLLAAKQHGRRCAGIELNPEYMTLAEERVGLAVSEPSALREREQAGFETFAGGGDGR
jgi:DNA modification methylase